MKRITQLVFLLIPLFCIHYRATAQSWQLVWQDEFTNGIGPDWVFETGTGSGGWGNNELQYYRSQNATVQNGQLVITARNESFGGMNYTSARLKTQGRKSWRYGRVEARIAMPAFQGVWPAFWMLGDNIDTAGWPACGEIDVMEHVNAENRTYGTIHWQDNNGQYASYGGNTAVGVTGFHIYAIEWTASSIKWFVDGVQFHEANILNSVNGTNEFHNNFFLILNMAIGGNWPGFTVNNGALPANMYIDYVRVYQQGSTPPGSVTIQAESYSAMLGVQTEACTDAGGGQNVGYIDANDWMAYNNINFPISGSYLVEYRVASQSGGGRLSLDLNAGSIQLGALNVPSTGGWQNWTTISHTVNVNAGTYNVGVFAQAAGWNLNWIRITKQGTARIASNTISTEERKATEEKTGFELFPNPVTDELRITTSGQLSGGLLRIYDIMGRQVLIVTQPTNRVNVAKLAPGMYTLLFTKEGKTITRRFVK
ncbi:T9SS C-terminal target domain-containing protein [Paraflavitalea soli]|uniref:T9SS C-terminal target domain-containing protein n=1 Tax=Paraflavitalea soli TaxID=2315862 RepID=A0A3B7MVA8_9BACT|nr:carbohydrate-binding protein [Paraflavitalea soli]AXY74361.1 T9SS C-terminal target domain-containing protein [Paraflavitalea soli]